MARNMAVAAGSGGRRPAQRVEVEVVEVGRSRLEPVGPFRAQHVDDEAPGVPARAEDGELRAQRLHLLARDRLAPDLPGERVDGRPRLALAADLAVDQDRDPLA